MVEWGYGIRMLTNELMAPRIGGLQDKTGLPEAPSKKIDGSFDKLLREKLPQNIVGTDSFSQAAPLKFSSHAMNRIRDRSISMGKEQLAQLEKAVDTAASKGAKESLILTPDAAFIVSVKNRTVITVLDRNAMSGNVFTNIDSTVVV